MNDILTDSDIARIEQEEILRMNIQAILAKEEQKPDSPKAKISQFLNSSFGIWLLSALFITWAGDWYSDWQKTSKEELVKIRAENAESNRRKEIYERVTLEISYRYSSTLTELRSVAIRYGDSTEPKAQEAIKSALGIMFFPASESVPPLYPEYKNFSSLALIAELRRYSKEGEEDVLKDVLANTNLILRELTRGSAKNPQTARTVAALLVSVMKNENWDNGFAYTDCESEAPFC